MENKDKIKEEILRLRKEIKEHDRLYEQNQPVISDAEYDKKYKKLEHLENSYPQFYDPNSPTKKLPTEKVDGLEEVEHSVPVLSLSKANSKEEVISFFQKSKGNPEAKEKIVQEKIDGLSIILTYKDGFLVDAVTRGSGYQGERVIHTVKTINNLPKQVSFKDLLVVRGELYITYDEFQRINIDGKYSNPRNLASGTVRQLDSSVAAKRNLQIKIIDLMLYENINFSKDTEALRFLEGLGFEVVYTELFTDIEKVVDYCANHAEKRKGLEYPIDGMVIKYNDYQLRNELSYTSKYPKWAISYKFENLEVTTKLKNIVNQVGKSGQITPVAVLDPVEIEDVKVGRATLHNYGNIQNKDLKIGDTVIVTRANDVIPQVVQSIKAKRNGSEQEISFPNKCPECETKVKQEGALLLCDGIKCVPQLRQKLIHFCKRDAMDINGIREKTARLLVEKKFIESIADIYKLKDKKEDLIMLEGFGKKSISNLLDSIEESKSKPLSRLLFALSIRHLGQTTSKIIAQKFKTLDKIIEATPEELTALQDIGPEIAQSVVKFFSSSANIAVIEELKKQGVNMGEEVTEEKAEKSFDFDGLTFVITGKLSSSRNEIKDFIQKNGGRVTETISKNTNYLLKGDGVEGSSKHKKALELGVQIISEEKLNQI